MIMGKNIQSFEVKPRYMLENEKFTVTGPVAEALLRDNHSAIENLGCTPRIERLRKSYFMNKPTVCLHRARIYTEVYKKTEGVPTVIRRGEAFKRHCEENPITIQNDELVIGNPCCRPRYVPIMPDYSWEWVLDELDSLSSREQDPYLISEEQKNELKKEIFPYWKGKSLHEYCDGHADSITKKLTYRNNLAGSEMKRIRGLGHAAPGFGNRIFPKGFKGIEADARKNLSKLSYTNPGDHKKIHFLKSVILSCQGMKILGKRHAEEARRLAGSTNNEKRRAELLKIAEVCDRVPYNPPETFQEAIQMCWFVQIGTKMVQGSTSYGFGRFDQFMYPYYKKDIEEGNITKKEAQELIECIWIKNAEVFPLQSEYQAMHFAGYFVGQNTNVGGLTREGLDATNELSFMCLEAQKNIRLNSPSLSMRVHRNTPDELLMKAVDVIRVGGGMPQLNNDDVGVKMMLKCGTTIEDAYDYDIRGCSEAQIQGKMWKYSDAGALNMGACLEWALNDGYSRIMDNSERWGLSTGDPKSFRSYDDVRKAFNKQLSYLTKYACISAMIIEEAHVDVCPEPYVSTLFDGPVETGVDYLEGGCVYNVGPAPQFTGLADVANSLAAIKKLVFEDKKLSMKELIDLLDTNFEGQEKIRLMLENRASKYGRDEDYVDEIAASVADFCSEEVRKYKCKRGCEFISGLYPVSANTPMGMIVGALPSGRKAGTPLAEGLSPSQGSDKSPTEAVKSATKFDHTRHLDGGMLNMKFTPSVLTEEKGMRSMISLIKTYFDLGGWHIQFNVVDVDTLKAAQKYPEKHSSLMVRVAGYSAYFIDLCKDTQDDIINRAEHSHF
jgi:choline trimethylamine-lyase